MDQEPNDDGHHLMDMRKKWRSLKLLFGKQQQLQLAAQVVKMILKIDDVLTGATIVDVESLLRVRITISQ